MAFRSDETWKFANQNFFKFLLITTMVTFLLHTIIYAIFKDYAMATNYSRLFFGSSFLGLALLLEIIMIFKFNWKGELSNCYEID